MLSDTLSNRFQAMRDDVLSKQTCLKIATNELEAAKDREQALATLKSTITGSREVLTAIARLKRQETTQRIEQIVTQGLQSVWDDPTVSLTIKEKSTAKRFNWVFSLAGRGYETEDITESKGGGVKCLVSFLLTIVLSLMLNKSHTRFYGLDEKFAHLSPDMQPAMGSFIAELGSKLGAQFLLVSHHAQVDESADRVYRFVQNAQGITSAIRVR